ncbi:MAG: DEAD/DEAH box helicase, partial [Armatimonadetes bacterium]|nr:DEAD/DEAH box helicase [Armatimonadota bacterium]
MERALARALLQTALGDGPGWPDPTELADRIASAELGLLFGDIDGADAALENTGWLLLAVASSAEATERYGVARQRAAFAVAGHILDLALRSQDRPWMDRACYTFAAQVCALGSGADPNAVALSRRAARPEPAHYDIISDLDRICLDFGIALLGMDTDFLARHLRSAVTQASGLPTRWDVDDIDRTQFAAAAHCVEGIHHCLRFLTDGEGMGDARRCFDAALRAPGATADHSSRWVAWHLRRISDQLVASSIWTVLPPQVPAWVRRALAHVPPRVVTLWPPQLAFLAPTGAGAPGLLDSDARRMVLTMPTSAGKTALAQIAVATHLVSESTGVCYVATSRSLCAEIRADLGRRLRPLNKHVAPERPDWGSVAEDVDSRAEVEVMTPERLAALLRTNADEVVSRFGMFVFDEAHHVADEHRGWTLEAAVSYLHFRLKDQPSRILLISAAIGNRTHFAQWLALDGAPATERHSDWRGPRRLTCLYSTEPEWDAAEELAPGRSGFRRRRVPLYGALRPTATPGSYRRTTKAIGVLDQAATKAKPGPSDWRKLGGSTQLYKTNAYIAATLATVAPPLLVIAATRDEADRLAREISLHLPPPDSLERLDHLLTLVHRRLGTQHSLATYLQSGVAVHTGALPDDVRAAVERAVRHGLLRCVVATTTVTDGVNLGVQSVFVASRDVRHGDECKRVVDSAKLLNAFGRAGRAMRETEGVAVLAHHSKEVVPHNELRAAGNEVLSSLAGTAAMAALEELEDRIRNDQDAVFEAAGAAGDFAAFCWFVAAELERIEDDRPAALTDIAKQTLALQQMDGDQQERW